MRSSFLLIVLLLTSLALSACGKKGTLEIPPEEPAPAADSAG